MKRAVLILTVFIVGVAVGFIMHRQSSLDLPMPTKLFIPIKDSASCHTIVGSAVTAGLPTSTLFPNSKKVKAKLFTDDENISIKTEGNEMYLLTKTAVEKGGAVRDENPSKILVNSPDLLVAASTYGREGRPIYDTFSLNKQTGIGLWTKVFTSEVISDNPFIETYMFACEAR